MTDGLSAFLELHPVAGDLTLVQTPVPVVDIDIAERNLRRWQDRMVKLGIANRPHIKTHKLAGVARYQVALGAPGLTVQKLSEAEAMAAAGIEDLFLTFNIVGAAKLERLAALLKRVAALSVVADHEDVVNGLAHAARLAGRTLEVLVECDTGAGRNGVQSPVAAADLAAVIDGAPGLSFGGLMTYPAPGTRAATRAFLAEAIELCRTAGLEPRRISSGGSPDMWFDEGLDLVTEYRAGTYVYNDRSLVARGVCKLEDCALTVLATVVSTPTKDRVIIDAGSKALTSDLLGLDDHGTVLGHPDMEIRALSEEHGHCFVPPDGPPLRIGDTLRIVPNHVCPVSNLFDQVLFVRGESVLGSVAVSARGGVT